MSKCPSATTVQFLPHSFINILILQFSLPHITSQSLIIICPLNFQCKMIASKSKPFQPLQPLIQCCSPRLYSLLSTFGCNNQLQLQWHDTSKLFTFSSLAPFTQLLIYLSYNSRTFIHTSGTVLPCTSLTLVIVLAGADTQLSSMMARMLFNLISYVVLSDVMTFYIQYIKYTCGLTPYPQYPQ